MMGGDIQSLKEEIIKMLEDRYPELASVTWGAILEGPIPKMHSAVYAEIDSLLVLALALATKGGSGPLGMDTYGWRNNLHKTLLGVIGKSLENLCNDAKTMWFINVR